MTKARKRQAVNVPMIERYERRSREGSSMHVKRNSVLREIQITSWVESSQEHVASQEARAQVGQSPAPPK